MPRVTISSSDSKHILKEKEAVQLNQIPISGISSHSASDDSYAGEKNLDSGTPNAADILRYLNDIMKKDGCIQYVDRFSKTRPKV